MFPVHIFGNKPSPAIANFGLRYITLHADETISDAVVNFIREHFYVDDALYSVDSVSDAISVLSGARALLGKYNIRLHKIILSHVEVLQAISQDLTCKDSEGRESECKTLGVTWQPSSDMLVLSPQILPHPFTKRGVLAIVNSIFDPIGIASPIVLKGRLLQRKIIPLKNKQSPEMESLGWDDPIPQQHEHDWIQWLKSLKDAGSIQMQRCYKTSGFGTPVRKELHCFSDASDEAIGHVIYLKQVNASGDVAVSFVFASSKMAPRAADTIPRLELCASMEVARSASRIALELHTKIDDTLFYTDSKIVMGTC